MTNQDKHGRYVDLDTEVVELPDGSRLTDERAEEIAEQELAKARRGRPSLSGGSKHSPPVSFRASERLRADAERVAADRHISVSQLAREALTEYVAHANH